MDAIEYRKSLRRICEYYGSCSKCRYGRGDDFCTFSMMGDEQVVSMIKFWVEEHHITYRDKFLEKFPNARMVGVMGALHVKDVFGQQHHTDWDDEYKELD